MNRKSHQMSGYFVPALRCSACAGCLARIAKRRDPELTRSRGS